MSLASYAAQCSGPLAEELATTPSAADIQTVRASLAAATRADWRRFHTDNAPAIAAFLAATPAQRRQRKAWQSYFPFLVLAAWQQCQQAGRLLHAASHLAPGPSYRHLAASAAEQWQAWQAHPLPDWPWPDPNPFDDMP